MSHSEQMIENQFIQILSEKENQWTYRPDLKSEEALWQNFRGHLNRINLAVLEEQLLTDKEFKQVKVEFSRLTGTPFLASQWLRGENGVAQVLLEREDGKKVTLEAFRNKDISGGTSSYEVVHQVVPDSSRVDRGDVSLLINGLPIIHIELKKESAKDGFMQAYYQIQRYAEDGFFKGIYATTQIMVISNKVDTRYFARPSEDTAEAYAQMKKFLFNWRTEDNQTVSDLFDFTRTVLRIPDAHELISQYTILVDDQKNQKFLMVLRPYQIHAIRKIRQKAAQHEGGFIWHATGSGKTITSFVATKLLAQNAIGVDRTVMVVDRTDLDAQTQDEFTKFASEYHTGQTTGNSVANTLIVGIKNQKQLARNLLSSKNNNTILVTTIQKLSAAMRSAQQESEEKGSNQFEKLRQEHIVFIVDEAHRAVSDEEMKTHDGQAQDTKKQETPGQKQPETEGSKTSDEETPDYIVITEVVDSSEHKQNSNQVVDGVAQTLDPDLLNEILAQTSEVGEYQIYVKNADELLISGPVPIQTANEDVNYPNLESSLNSASIYLGQKNRYELANEEDAQSGLALVEE